MLDPDERAVGKGTLCGRSHGYNVQNATRIAAKDKAAKHMAKFGGPVQEAEDWLN